MTSTLGTITAQEYSSSDEQDLDTMATPVEPPQVETLEDLAKKLKTVELMVRRLVTRDTARRAKMLALQAAFIRTLKLHSTDTTDPAATIFPVEVAKNPQATARVLAFGSMGDNMGMTSREFFKIFENKNVEIIFFKDFEQCWYLQGLMGLTTNIPETHAFIQSLLASKPPLPTLTVGASSGGYAAILFGALLGCERVLAFSPQTEVTRRVIGRYQSVDSDMKEIDIATQYCDLNAVLTGHGYSGRMDIYFARNAPFDRQQAERLDGVPGVQLHALPWHGHNTAAWLKGRGQLADVIDSSLLF